MVAYHCLLLPIVAYFLPSLGKSHFFAMVPPMAYRCLFLAYHLALSLPIIAYRGPFLAILSQIPFFCHGRLPWLIVAYF